MEIGNEKILLVDDEKSVCTAIEMALGDRGYNIVTTQSGIDAFNKLQNEPFDIIVTDIKMPDMNGLKILETAKEIDPSAKVIIITGFASIENARESLRMGAFDYITKPFEIAEVENIITRAAEKVRLERFNEILSREFRTLNSKMEEKLTRKTEEIAALFDIGHDISSRIHFEEVLKNLAERIAKVLNSEIVSIILLDERTGELRIRYAIGLEEEVAKNGRFKYGESISGWVVKNREPLLVKDIEIDTRFRRRSHEKYYTRSFISAPLIFENEIMGVINVNNKRTMEPYSEEDLKMLETVATMTSVAVKNVQYYQRLQQLCGSVICAMAKALDARDPYTLGHSSRVARLALILADNMGFSPEEKGKIYNAGLLHDIGKISVSDGILQKRYELTFEEWNEVKKHPCVSENILEPLPFLKDILPMVRHHHEHFDGSGYPDGLRGDTIPFGARILAAADSYDAMLSRRPYRKALAFEECIRELKEGAGKQFDPQIVDIMLKLIKSREIKP